MITEFQDGFITKTKLNELVGGINDIDSNILTADITKTVGSGGDFTTLNLAIDWCKKVIPNGYNLALVITDSVIKEYLFIENCNLGFVEIASANGSTITEKKFLTFCFLSLAILVISVMFCWIYIISFNLKCLDCEQGC